MAYDEMLANRIREILVDIPNVEEKEMFRGLTFMVNGKMCVGVSGNELMCRIDPSIHEAAVERNGCRAMEMKGKVYKGFVFIDPASLVRKDELDFWIGLVLEYDPRAKASKKNKK